MNTSGLCEGRKLKCTAKCMQSQFGHLFFVVLVGAVSRISENHEPLSREQQLEEGRYSDIPPKYAGDRIASGLSQLFQKLNYITCPREASLSAAQTSNDKKGGAACALSDNLFVCRAAPGLSRMQQRKLH